LYRREKINVAVMWTDEQNCIIGHKVMILGEYQKGA